MCRARSRPLPPPPPLPTVSDSAVKIASVSDVSAIGRGANSAGDGTKSGGKLFSQLLEVPLYFPELKCSLPLLYFMAHLPIGLM